ncbi:MAG: hypothetical protein Tsb0013_04570 [Phycisphaerales bacterium]
MPKGKAIALTWLFTLLGVLVLAGAGYFTYEHATFLQRAVEAEAKVVERDQEWSSSASTTGAGSARTSRRVMTYRPTFEYTDEAGVTRTGGPTGYNSEWDWPVGATVTVRYDPDTPTDVRPKSSFFTEWVVPLILGAIGLGFIVISTIARSGIKSGRTQDVIVE